LNFTCDLLVSTFAFKFNLCRYSTAPADGPLSCRRLSGDLVTHPTRPLREKVGRLLEVILHRLIDYTQSPSEGEFMKQLKKAREKAPK
jgi:hypothetical protein